MDKIPENIHPSFETFLSRASKEQLLKQKAKVLWFTGLSGSGKTTIAKGLEYELQTQGFLVMVLDGDNVRAGINNNLGFSYADRMENIRRIAEVAKLFLSSGVITICCFVSPTKEIRELAKSIIGESDFAEIFVDTPIAECERRDVKGLYAKARKGEIKDFTGINAPFEAPAQANLVIKTENKSVTESIEEAVKFTLPIIEISNPQYDIRNPK